MKILGQGYALFDDFLLYAAKMLSRKSVHLPVLSIIILEICTKVTGQIEYLILISIYYCSADHYKMFFIDMFTFYS